MWRTGVASLKLKMDCFAGKSRFASTQAVSRHLTLRNINLENRTQGGCMASDVEPPEMCGSTDGQYISSLVRFTNVISHIHDKDA